ncbi:DUF418 domain-containing protein [Corynebacterium sp. CCUG 70398]|nr:DUF418 domain-containing protein [Corynebacterium sp. CCUG 70398]
MALTCYILQNVIASVIFYDFGFGVARRIQGPLFTLTGFCSSSRLSR